MNAQATTSPSNRIEQARVVGICCAVPESARSAADEAGQFGSESVERITASTGVKQRRVAGTLCTSDLCLAAADRLLAEAAVDRASIDALIFVSQTPDYVLPATACVLHGRLGLAKSCAAFDINLGCSGYVYGLWMAASLLSAGAARTVLLLVGDTISRTVSPEDRSVGLLFGDAGTATLLTRDSTAPPMHFVLGTDGAGWDKLIIPAGGFREPIGPHTRERREAEGGNRRGAADLYMNGAEIFAFSTARVPAAIRSVMEGAALALEQVDALVLHQANRFMLQHLGKKMGIPEDKLAVAIEEFGNTSSASIPLALASTLAEPLRSRELRLVLCGFGVGFSWASCAIATRHLVMPGLVEVPAARTPAAA